MTRRAMATMALMLLLVTTIAMPATAADSPDRRAGDELKWGAKAARRGYWQEALMRFERADGLTPNQPRILNNIAVSLEALGRYDEAGEVYRRALAVAPNDSALRRNHHRFEEFVRDHVAASDSADEASATAGTAPDLPSPDEPEDRAGGEGGDDA